MTSLIGKSNDGANYQLYKEIPAEYMIQLLQCSKFLLTLSDFL